MDNGREELKVLSALAITQMPPRLQTDIMQCARDNGDILSAQQHSQYWSRISSLLTKVEQIRDHALKMGVQLVPFSGEHYPMQLSDLSFPPPILFVRSSFPLPTTWPGALSIVGARKASMEMCTATTKLARDLRAAGQTVVSGLALGIDGAAHRGALQTSNDGIPTIAVVAHGLDRIYPSSHQPLGEEILRRGGMLLSEYSPGVEPLRHHFLARNRIIAALSLATIVVQAGERSGSLVTAQSAIDIGREVFVLQCDPEDSSCAGGSKLIEDGAIPISGAREVLTLCGVEEDSETFQSQPVTVGVRVPLTEFLRLTRLSGAQLLKLEMEGGVSRVPGNYVVVSEKEWERLTA